MVFSAAKGLRTCRPRLGRACLLLFSLAASSAQSVEEGIELFEKGRYVEAEAALSGSTDKRARAFVALSQAATGRCDQATDGLDAAFKDKADERIHRLAGLALSRCQIAAKQFAKALPQLSQLAEEFPDDADVLYETARLHLKAWNGSVEQMFDNAPASFRVNQLSAEIFEIRGQFAEAVAEYRRAIEKRPNTINLHYRLGRALLMESHSPESLAAARSEFEAELALNPNDAVAEYQIAQILEVEGKSQEAQQHLENAVGKDAGFTEALIALGRALSATKNYARAITLLKRASELAPQSESAHYNLMIAYRNAGQREQALEVKQRLDELQKSPDGEFTDFLKRIGESSQQ
jgi:tetratricopeptide (TPR) repeat protein